MYKKESYFNSERYSIFTGYISVEPTLLFKLVKKQYRSHADFQSFFLTIIKRSTLSVHIYV